MSWINKYYFLSIPFFGFIVFLFLVGCARPTTNTVQDGRHKVSFTYHHNSLDTKPVVVFQSGLGDDKSTWATVISQLPKSQAFFAYDRYGYGKSQATKSERNPCNIAREQHEILKAANVKPPYLLVGHSIGGLYEYVFALMYPQDVAGLILLDPTHPHHWQTIQRDAPAAATILKTMRYTVFTPVMRSEFGAQSNCLESLPANIDSKFARNTQIFTSTRVGTGEQGAFQDVLLKLRKDWVDLTGILATEPVEKSKHYIQKDRPDFVVSVIKEFMEVNL